ncbi:hypothetical protein [Deinococcus aquatilis]|uniref:hypothetical protein n=1 Tax=Deinococcus aquatilis TaxID=519440 RepID=UPI00039F9EC5|nr:hypothetical protein [Deinococcus aquatilis]
MSVLLVPTAKHEFLLTLATLVVFSALATWILKRSLAQALMNAATWMAVAVAMPLLFWIFVITLGLMERIDGISGIAGGEWLVLIVALLLLVTPVLLWLRWYLMTFPPVTLAIVMLGALPHFQAS